MTSETSVQRAPESGVTIRPIGPGDETRVADLLHRMSNESLHLRFFTVPSKAHLRAEIERLTRPTSWRHAAVGAEIGGALVGVASFERTEPTDGRAELAILVDDSFQGRGVGRRLTEQLAELAQEHKITELTASVLASNVRMLRLARSMAASASSHAADGVIEITVPLEPICIERDRSSSPSDRPAHARWAPYSTTFSAPVSAGREKTS